MIDELRPGTVADVTGVLLAGGRARRMGGQDKGLIELAGRPLAAHALDRLQPQVAEVVLNANRNQSDYARLGVRVVPDSVEGFLGPLAGLLAGMESASTPLVVTAPCDSPFVPADLVERLLDAREASGAQLAVAHDGERQQPVFLLAECALAPGLRDWLLEGGRKIDAWFAGHRLVDVPFTDTPDAFININTEDERAAVEQRLQAPESPR
ncbi:MAG: molybdenum cofactor guanylyltransferase MobA [Halofilum sp. (in: g-proteobacteria)]|nr:molybdenum cofactor guanylyltransferase MobA [Halofilum sp. (in: g-proteobacteria)]